jgi:zinc protease
MAAKVSDLVEKVNTTKKRPEEAWSLSETLTFGGAPLYAFTLGNGLRLLLLVDTSAKVVSYFTWFRVGSRHEKPGKTGLAHLFEHLMFNETEGLKAGQFDRTLEENGAESNAATWLDWTYYYESLPADRFGLAVKLESERMARLVLREPQVKSEKEVVANERRYRVEDDVEGAANELLYKTAFGKHPYHWPTIGWMDDIKNFSPDDCEKFYETFYAPNNATLVVVGDVKVQDVLTKVRDAYGPIDAGDLPVEDTEPEPYQLEERVLDVGKPTASEKAMVGYKGPALGDVDHPTLVVLSEILFGGRASRLYEKLVIEKELVTDLRGWVSTFRDPGLFEMSFFARGDHTCEDILAAVEPEMQRLHAEVVTSEELERAKARLELGLLATLDTTSGKAEQIGFYDTVLGDPGGAFARLAAYRRVTAGDIRTAARRYLQNARRTIVKVRREKNAEQGTGSADAERPGAAAQ